MDIPFLLIALALPVLLGSIWLRVWIPVSARGRVALILGNGSLIGLLVIPLLMRMTDAVGISPGFTTTGVLAAFLIIVGGLASARRGPAPPPSPHAIVLAMPIAHRVLFIAIAALLVLRLCTLGLELLWRPLFPWDATMHWATKARVWFDQGTITPFVENHLWFELRDQNVFTDHHPGYPITIPLLQVWMNSAIGHWDESTMNLPWLLCLMALGAAFYGQARVAGVSRTLAISFTYLLLSMPLINTHVALAGYADLFLGACYGAALMAFHNWTVSRQVWQGCLALSFAIGCTLIKNEGFYWLLTFIPALVVVLLPWRKAVALLVILMLVLAGALFLIPGDFAIAGHSLDQLNLHYRPGALQAIAANFYLHDSWHLFGYLVTAAVPLGLFLAGSRLESYRGIIIALACALSLFMVLFLFTNYAWGAIRFTAVGRITIHLVPGLMFLTMLMCKELSGYYDIKRTPLHGSQLPS